MPFSHDIPVEQSSNLRAEMEAELFNCCIEEMLHLASPRQFGNREAARDIEIDGVAILSGTNLHLCIGVANRDPAVFGSPGSFDIARKPNRHLAFAGGAISESG